MSHVSPSADNLSAEPSAQPNLFDNKEILSVLAPGLSAVLDMQPDDPGSVRYTGTIVGWQEKAFIAWQTRIDPKKPWRIVHDEESVLRFLACGRACAVHTLVTDWHARGNQRIVYLAWPSKLQLHVVRQDSRVELQTPCNVTLRSGAKADGTLVQLGLGGCRIHVPDCQSSDSPVSVSFRLPNGFAITELVCENRHAFAAQDAIVFGCKTDVSGLSAEGQSAIYFFVSTSQAYVPLATEMVGRVLMLGGSNPVDPDVLNWFNAQGLKLVEAATVIDFYAHLQSGGANALLLNGELEHPTASDIVRTLRASEGYAQTPVVVFGGAADAVDGANLIHMPTLNVENEDFLKLMQPAELNATVQPDEDAERTVEPEEPAGEAAE